MAWLAVALLPAAASAQNLLSNPDFDSDLAGWYTFATWSSEDWQGSGTSGSATLVNSLPSSGTDTLAKQCVELPTLEEGYEIRGWLMSQSADGGAGSTKVGIVWFDQPGCATYLDGVDSANVDADTGWNEVRFSATPHAGTESAEISAYIYKNVGAGTLAGYLDHVALLPSAVFADGFESGDWLEWSFAAS